MAEKEFLQVEDVAQEFGITPEAVRKLVHETGLPCRKAGNRWLFSRQGLHAWLASGNYDTEQLRRGRGKGNVDENTDAE